MSDGRIFTNYSPNCQINIDLQKIYNTDNIHAYRHYLQTNAEKVMNDTKISAEKCASCPICNQSLTYKPSGDITKQ